MGSEQQNSRGRMTALRISAKTLGELACADFCPRCFWLGIPWTQPVIPVCVATAAGRRQTGRSSLK